MRARGGRRGASALAGAAALLLAIAPIACSKILGIHDIAGPDGGESADATGPGEDVTSGEASGDAPVEARSDGSTVGSRDGGSDDASVSDVTVDGPRTACDLDAGGQVVAAQGCPCSAPGATACPGLGQPGFLVCTGAVWAAGGNCPQGHVCDPHAGPMQGTCVPADTLCAGQAPGALVCADDVTVARCSDDLLSHAVVTTCSGKACIAGVCAGVCMPGSIQGCASEYSVTTCTSSGQWTTTFCTEPNPDCGSIGATVGCTCFGHHGGLNCVEPTRIGTATNPGWHVAVDATRVYWTDMGSVSCDGGTCMSNDDAHIQSVPKAGGPTTTYVGSLPPQTLFRVNTQGIYWESPVCPGDGGACTATLSGLDLEGGAPTIVGATPAAGDFALDDTAAYVVEQGTGLVRVPLDGSQQTLLVSTSEAQRVAISATTAYVTDFAGSIWSTPLGGGGASIVTSSLQPVNVAVDSSNLYWNDITCPDGGACQLLLAMPLGSSTAAALATPATVSNIVPYGANVYFTDSQTVMSVPAAGGPVTVVAAPKGGLYDIAVDATNVYWADSGGYGVWAIAHP